MKLPKSGHEKIWFQIKIWKLASLPPLLSSPLLSSPLLSSPLLSSPLLSSPLLSSPLLSSPLLSSPLLSSPLFSSLSLFFFDVAIKVNFHLQLTVSAIDPTIESAAFTIPQWYLPSSSGIRLMMFKSIPSLSSEYRGKFPSGRLKFCQYVAIIGY